ncbi:MAG: substrate-binding domain-containing protein [Planctomycetota bacterium]
MTLIFRPNVLLRQVRAAWGLVLPAALLLFSLWPWLPINGRGARHAAAVVFYGFSILGEVMNQGVFPAFRQAWQDRTGERIELVGSFAGSGTVTNQLIMGVPAQLALLSLELDAARLADAQLTPRQSWVELPHCGVVNRTPFVILVRPGNPKQIRDFADLARHGIGVVHPDPLTSGGANWAILAEYGAGARAHPDDPEAGHDLLLGIWRNVVGQAASARAARTQFENGFGDALVTYEQEVLWDRARGKLNGEIVYPHSTILSEHTLVRIDRNIAAGDRELIDALVLFLWQDQAQRVFVQYGFRSVDERLNTPNPGFGRIADAFSVADLGGWPRAKREIIDAVWKDRVLQEIGK